MHYHVNDRDEITEKYRHENEVDIYKIQPSKESFALRVSVLLDLRRVHSFGEVKTQTYQYEYTGNQCKIKVDLKLSPPRICDVERYSGN